MPLTCPFAFGGGRRRLPGTMSAGGARPRFGCGGAGIALLYAAARSCAMGPSSEESLLLQVRWRFPDMTLRGECNAFRGKLEIVDLGD
jgi:hypothetical protein